MNQVLQSFDLLIEIFFHFHQLRVHIIRWVKYFDLVVFSFINFHRLK